MILFPIYALTVWYLTMRWRRRFLGFVMPVLGSGGAMLITWVLKLAGPDTFLPLGVLLTAEGLVVMSVGLFIACLPREPSGPYCGHCWYDMQGLDGRGGVCPECGIHRPLPSAGRRGVAVRAAVAEAAAPPSASSAAGVAGATGLPTP